MFWILRQLRRDYRTWDRPTQLAFSLSLGLIIPGVALALLGPDGLRPFAWFGAGALLIVAQIAVLWGNRGMVGVLVKAQRAYLAGDLDGARTMLEALHASGRADARALTLLGNVYRQLGMLDESLAALYEALDKAPETHFPLTGFGRTLLARGEYIAAADTFARALETGASEVVRLDLGEAHYRLSQIDEARTALADLPAFDEPGRALMAVYLRYRIDVGEPPTRDQILSGVAFLRAAAERFAATPYGEALADDVRVLDRLTEET